MRGRPIRPLGAPSGGPAATILIADGNLEDTLVSQKVIESVNPQLWTRNVRSGKKLIGYLQGEGVFSDRTDFPYPNLILLDLKIGGMHGLNVLCWLLNHPPHNLVPVVALSVSDEKRLADAAFALGARAFVVKPLRGDDLKSMIETAPDRRRHSPIETEFSSSQLTSSPLNSKVAAVNNRGPRAKRNSVR